MFQERNNAMELKEYDKKHIRVKKKNGEVFEGIAEYCYDEDDTNEYVLYLPHYRWKNCVEEIHESDIDTIVVLPD